MLVFMLMLLALLSLDIRGSPDGNESFSGRNDNKKYDVIIFSATPAGCAAALAAKASGAKSVLLVEPTNHVGGMATAGGIGLRDCQLNQVRENNSTQYEWAMRNARFYGVDEPVWQPDNWVGELMFLQMLSEARVELRLRTTFVEGEDGVVVDREHKRISAIQLESGEVLEAKYFIDASYEGELMMATGQVTYTFGREPQSQYGESYAGVSGNSKSQFIHKVNPYVLGSQELLGWVQDGPDPRNITGQQDYNLMAYSFRACLTMNKTSMLRFPKPPGYNPADFELARRYLLEELIVGTVPSRPWGNLPYHNYPTNKLMKYDACCGYSPLGIDAVGLAVGYPNGTRAQRKSIYDRHKYYVQGLMWFWTNDPVVPQHIRDEMAEAGLCEDEWPDNDHFPPQLYVREAVRIVGDKVFTQNDRENAEVATANFKVKDACQNSVAVGSWGYDIHDMERVTVIDEETGKPMVYNEGLTDFDYGGMFLFNIPYYILLPKRSELVNLAVPNCPSVSHVMFSALRVEPTLWQIGQAAGTAVGIAVDLGDDIPLQDVNVYTIKQKLVEQETFAHWPPTLSLDCS